MVSPTSALHILVVDDSATSCVVLQRQLQALGCTVVVANNGPDALVQVQAGHFDLVLLDCFMPGMDGFTVVRTIRHQAHQSGSRHLPVIAISGDDDDAHVQLCMDSGMDGLLGKPVDVDALEKILVLWCGPDRQARDVTPKATLDVAPDISDWKKVDLPALFRRASQEDYALLDEAAKSGNREVLKRLVHRMKGAALTMKADAMVATLKRIEALLANPDMSLTVLQEDMLVLRQHITALPISS